MSMELTEGRLTFTFPDDKGQASKYDDWTFYRKQLTNAFGKSKAVDMIWVDKQQTWLIEIKDFRTDRRTKPIDLAEEVALKVRDTLAGLIATRNNGNDADERQFAAAALKKKRFRVVLHLEQPRKHSKLFPRAIDPSKVKLKLKQWLKAIDAHPSVVDQHSLAPSMEWSVKG